ncbi:MAG: DUF1203 domain-containing protein [Bacteroidota bacterium]
MNFIYLPIPQTSIDKIRNNREDDFGHTVEISIAGESGYGPCRCCLKQFKEGEKRLLFSYAPVGADHPYNEIGPVFIHEHCFPYSDAFRFPEEIKNGSRPIHLVLRCYNNEKRMILARFVKDNHEVENTIAGLFADPQIEFIHVRNAAYQCYIAEVRKDQGTGS